MANIFERIFVSLTDVLSLLNSQSTLGTPNSTPFKACTTRYVLMPFQLDLFPLRCRSLSLLRFYCLVSVYAMSTNPAAALRSFATLV